MKKNTRVYRIDESLEMKINEFGKKNNLIRSDGKVKFREASKKFAKAYDEMLRKSKDKSVFEEIKF